MEQYPDNRERRLQELFAAYSQACVIPEASPNFMPQLWQKIESRQSITSGLARVAYWFVTAAVALTFVFEGLTMISNPRPTVNRTYVEVLAADHLPQVYIEPVRLSSEESR